MGSNYIFKEGQEVYSCLFENLPMQTKSAMGKIIKIEKDNHYPLIVVFKGLNGRQRFSRNGTAKGQEVISLSSMHYRFEKTWQ